MLLEYDGHPDESLYTIGAYILKINKDTGKYKWDIFNLYDTFSKNYPNSKLVPFQIFTLGVDWLFLLDLIRFEGAQIIFTFKT